MGVNSIVFIIIIFGSFSTTVGIFIDDDNYDYNIKNTSSIDSKACYLSLKYYNSIGINNFDVIPLGINININSQDTFFFILILFKKIIDYQYVINLLMK